MAHQITDKMDQKMYLIIFHLSGESPMRSDMSSSSIGFGTSSNSIENYDRQSASPLRTSTPICSPSPEKEIPALNIVDQVEQDNSR